MKKTLILLLAMLTCLLSLAPAYAEFNISDAGLAVSGSAQQLGKPDSFGSEKITVPVPEENALQSGVNPITGESWQGEYHPVLVNIDSHPRALPHWGVASADLIYELPIQADGSTRQVALFMGEYPELAGPVRSARIPMASLREMWGAPYYFFGYQGGTTSVKEWVQKYSANKKFSYPYIELMNKKKGVWYDRSGDGGHVAPYNVTLIMDKVREEYNVSPNTHAFLFDDTGLTRGERVNGVVIPYKTTSPAYLTAYQYNEATGLYDRYRNGTPYTDMLTGQGTSFANVIVIRTNVSFMNNNPSRPVIRLNGQGVCEIFQNGHYIRGTWVRNCSETKNLNNRMIFLDENGNELPMKVGKTFIQIVDNEQPVIAVSDEVLEGSIEPQVQRLMIGDGTNASSTKKRPKATRTPRPTRTPEPTATPEPTPEVTATPELTPTPEPEVSDSEQTEPEQTQPEQTQPEQTQPEQNQPEQTQPEQTQPEQNQPEQTQPEQTQPEQTEPEQTQPEQTQPEQTQPEQTQPEQTQHEQTEPEQTQPEQSQPEQTELEKTEPEQAEPEKIEEQQSEQSEPEQTEAQQSEPEQAEPQQAEPQQSETEQVELQQAEPDQTELQQAE